MLIIKQKFISREDLKNNPDILYIFGDNLGLPSGNRTGFGGQAKEMRGEPNAFGIATKNKPEHGSRDCYFRDSEEYFKIVDNEFKNLIKLLETKKFSAIIISSDGVGTGLANLQEYAPNLLNYINKRFDTLTDI